MRHYVLYLLLLLELLYIIGTTIGLLLFDKPYIWALPIIVYWLHVGFLFPQLYYGTLRRGVRSAGASAAVRNLRTAWWCMSFLLFLGAIASSVLFGYLHVSRPDLLPIVQFIFLIPFTLWAILRTIDEELLALRRTRRQRRRSHDIEGRPVVTSGLDLT